MSKIILAAFIALILIASFGCHKNYYNQPDYVDAWNNGSGTAVTFGTDNTYSLTVLSLPVSAGKYTAQKNVLSLTGISGDCHDSLPATYTYIYSSTTVRGTFYRQLTISANADSCTARVTVMPGLYTMPNP